MSEMVKVEIEVTPEAAELLQDDLRRRALGALISRSIVRPEFRVDRLRELFAEIEADAKAAGVTDEDIDAELAAYNAERRG